VDVLSVTDHDTVAGAEAAARACTEAGIQFVPGIEITSVLDGADVHVLGYFIDVHSPGLQSFLLEQRRRRLDRVRQMVDRLGVLGLALDAEAILQPGLDDPSKAVGRPAIARALVAAGHVATTNEAFQRWLARGRPAFVPRRAAPPAEVFLRIHEAGGIASLAHPGILSRDEWIPSLVDAGLDAIEAFHTEHVEAQRGRYLDFAHRLGAQVTGGSDYHGDESHGGGGPGGTSLPQEYFDRLVQGRTPPRGGVGG
jgi:predicted metal-dependent phosphoesterase TrpH